MTESVWDYPRPPRVEDCDGEIRVEFGGEVIATTRGAKRVLETSHPPVYYLPRSDVKTGVLIPTRRTTFCEWKGHACYFDVVLEDHKAVDAAWQYLSPSSGFESLRDHVAFYAELMEACYVDGERVQSQVGGFYGGWITSNIVGPFKGPAGTQGW